MNRTKQHVFEKANLGLAPYSLVSVEMREQAPDSPRVGTSCDYCGTYITNIFCCKSSDGKKFVIGSTCVEKLGDAGLTRVVNDRVREYQKIQRRAREQQRMTQVLEQFNSVKELLAEKPHPNSYLAAKGKTLLDYVEYCGVYSHTSQRMINSVK